MAADRIRRGAVRLRGMLDHLRDRRESSILCAAVFLLSCATFGVLGFLSVPALTKPQERSFTVVARQYAYDPPVIRVNLGDTVHLRFTATDVVHGFYLEGHALDVKVAPMQSTVELYQPNRPGASEPVEEVVFTANREGKFRYRCSHTCGFLHPFMLGELIVEPNRLLPTSIGLAVGVLAGGFLIALMRGRSG